MAGGVITGTSASVTGGVTAASVAGGVITGSSASLSGNVTGGNVLTGGQVSATGNVSGANLNVTGNIVDTGPLSLITAASGNVNLAPNGTNVLVVTTTGANIAGTLNATGNATVGNLSVTSVTGTSISVSGGVTAASVAGGVITGTSTSVTGTQTAASTVGGVITGSSASVTGTVTAASTVGGVITGSSASVTGTVTAASTVGGVITGSTASLSGNINGANLILSSGFIDGPAAGRITINGSDIDTDFAVDGDTTANVFYVDAGTGTASFGNSTQVTNALVSFQSTNSIRTPVGNTAQRPAVGVTGMLRFNTTTDALEIYDNDSWASVGTPTFTVIADEQFSGNGVQVAFTLSSTQTTNSCIVSINGVVQIPTLAYSVSGTNPTCVLTFTEAPASGDVIDVRQITTTTSVTSISNSPGNAVIAVNATVGNVEITGNFMPTSNTIANIGSQSFQFNTIFAKATSAQYADLAEKYTADADYAPGTVVMFGGTAEVTLCVNDACSRVAGVISTNPSYRMNDGLQSEHTAMVALTGRVPTSVTGTVRKGDMMVSAGNGTARAEPSPQIGTVIGKALADSDGDAVIEVVVGRV